MLAGLSGSLVSQYFAERILLEEFSGRLGEASLAAAEASFARWWHAHASQLGPASSVRSIWDVAAVPLVELLGFAARPATGGDADARHALLVSSGGVALVATTWNVSLDNLWRDATRRGIGLDAAWVLCTNGRELRLVDTERTYSRDYLQFDLGRTVDHSPTFGVLWGLLREEAFRSRPGEPSLVLDIIRSSGRHGQAVSRSLRVGVIEAVQHLLGGSAHVWQARPLAALRRITHRRVPRALPDVRRVARPRARTGIRSTARVTPSNRCASAPSVRARRPACGRRCRPSRGSRTRAVVRARLVVPPFNGRLFSPARSPIAESCAVDDEVARQALLALSTTTSGRPRGRRYVRTRIDYRDLGVEQLGAVYESVLDYEPAFAESGNNRILLRRGGDRRKATGSFYTPHTLTDYVVRRTLHPLVEGASPERILQLRVVDPAMGSAAFLVSACRYLARAYERALRPRRRRRRAGHRRSRPRAVQAAHRAAVSLRRRPQSHGGAARAPVALARHTVGQQAAHLPRPSPRVRQQPHRRIADRHRETAARRPPRVRAAHRPWRPRSRRHATLLRPRPRAFARARGRRAPMARRDTRRHRRCRSRKGTPPRWLAGDRPMEVDRRSVVRVLDVARPRISHPTRRYSRRWPTN